MICEPKKWSENTTGGYLLSEFNELNKNISIVRDNPYMKEHSKISKDQISTVNYLNNIPFEINNTMLDYLLLEWKNTNSVIFKEYNKLHPLSKELDNNNLDSNMKKEILKHNSIHWNYSNILNISALMREQTIYLPTFLDFRGRVYPIPVYLSYQGSDLARSLLLFKNVGLKIDYNNIIQQIVDKNIKNKLKKLILNDIDYVKLYLANVFGLNKLNRNNRIKWFNENIKEMLYLLNNDNMKFNEIFLNKAKEPAQFISCLLEYNKYEQNIITEIKTPILFDATCSGIQHLSALTSDIEIAKLVNLIESTKDEPSDFYEFSITNVVNTIENLPDSDSHLKNKLLKLNLKRSFLKHSIMTVPYNVTNIGIADKLSEQFLKSYISLEEATNLKSNGLIPSNLLSKIDSIDNTKTKNITAKGFYIYKPLNSIIKDNFKQDEIIFTQNELNKLGNIIKQTVLSLIPPFTKLKNYFDSIIDILNILEMPVY